MKFLVDTSDSNNFEELKRALLRFGNKKTNVENLRDQQLITIRTDLNTGELSSLFQIPNQKLQLQKRDRPLDYLQKFEILREKDRGDYFEESSTEKK